GVVHSPPLVFLDEPTSGLDAFSALCVMESIRALARAGHVVACTIHQPRQAIVAMFDKVLFLACGHLVYNGPPSGLKDWLMKSELWDPDRALTTSITDMVLDCITVGFEKPPHIYGMHTLRDEQDVERLAMAYLQGTPKAQLGSTSLPPVSRLVHKRHGI
ncbi:ABC transporter G family member 7 (ABC transporter ABCG.7) (AtABCG7) (White-brown complex homolog protein 7) (AtWBC7), partial [Durusdinium trenchii]